MPSPLVLATGFGPFPGIERNPSAEIARALEEAPPVGVEVRSAVLRVAFAAVGAAWDELIAGSGARTPALLLSLGVHPGPAFRLERTARARLGRGRPDVDDEEAPATPLLGGDRVSSLDLAALADALRAAGAPEVEVSGDAGGYVCDRTYHHLLGRSAELGVPGLFLHVPPADVLEVPRQVAIVRGFLHSALPQLKTGA